VKGVGWDQTPTKVKVVLNIYSFDEVATYVSVNRHDPVASEWRSTDATFAWRSVSIEVPVSDVGRRDQLAHVHLGQHLHDRRQRNADHGCRGSRAVAVAAWR